MFRFNITKKITLSLIILINSSCTALAHPGGTDTNGGHVQKSTSQYHCHKPDCVLPTAIEPYAPEKIKIATFNIQIFGKSKIKKSGVMAELATIIRKYDLIAIQEIKDISGSTAPKFLEVINAGGDEYDFIISERGGRQPSDKSSQEQYAYFYKTATITPVTDGDLYDDSANDYFQREPFVAPFRVVGGNFSFVLMTIHTRPESALTEIDSLKHVYAWAKQQYPNEDDFIALGDFNAGCNYTDDDDLNNLDIHNNNFTWVVPHTADTNFSTKSACAYDRIVLTNTTNQDYTGEWGIDTVSEKRVSDHFPVWAEFYTLKDK